MAITLDMPIADAERFIAIATTYNSAVFFFNVPRHVRTDLIEFCYKHNKDIYIYPDISDIIIYSSSTLLVDDTTVLASTDYGMSFEQLFLKRLGDIIFSLLLIIITSPIMLFFGNSNKTI